MEAYNCQLCIADRRFSLLRLICKTLNISEASIDTSRGFASSGGDSISALSLVSLCKRVGVVLDVKTILISANINDLITAADFSQISDTKISACCHFESRVRQGQDSCSDVSGHKTSRDVNISDSTLVLDSPWLQRAQPRTTPKPQKRKHEILPFESAGREHDRVRKRSRHDVDSRESMEQNLSEMQALLLQNNNNDLSSNVMAYSETYKLSDLEHVKLAWSKTFVHEPSLQRRIVISHDGSSKKLVDDPGFYWHEIETDSYETFRDEMRNAMDGNITGSCFKVIILDQGLCEDSLAVVIWKMHHALIDGYSAALVYRNFQHALNGRLMEPRSAFSQVLHQLVTLQLKRRSEAQTFWQQRQASFEDAVSRLALPKPIKKMEKHSVFMSKVAVHSPIKDLHVTALRAGCTLSSLYMTAWAIVLSRYVCSDNVAFGVVMSGRTLPLDGVDRAVGLLINTLPLCIKLRPDEPLSTLARTVFEELSLFSEFEFSCAIDGFERSFSSAIAMQFEMNVEKGSIITPIRPSELEIASDIPLSICIDKDGKIQLFYKQDIYREADIILLAEHFKQTLEQMIDLSITVDDCLDRFLSPKCERSLSIISNSQSSTSHRRRRPDTLLSLFEKTVMDFPEYTAIEVDKIQITYSSLHGLMFHVAQQLAHDVQPGDAVCIHADRSKNWIIGIFATIVLGGVYVPLNPASNNEIREENFRACSSRIYLAPHDSQSQFAPNLNCKAFSIESLLSNSLDSYQDEFSKREVKPDMAAYTCFTSGSSGPPKAVTCTHEGLVAFQSSLEVRLMARPGLRISQIMSPVFDGSIHEIFSALTYGATLVLTPSFADIAAQLSMVDSAIMTPSLAGALNSKDFPNLRFVYLVGEIVPQSVCDSWASGRELYNMYGPTEATCGATITRLFPGRPITIGRPNPSSRVYILDHNKRQVPPGVTGEIYLAGVQVAMGYMGRLAESQARFLPDTVNPHLKEKMYRTGDFGYWTSRGEVMYLGRRDRQIKLRGFRVDLNHLESRMSRALPEAYGVAVAQSDGELIAMVRPATMILEAVREKMIAALEPQFVPRHLIAVNDFPLSMAGKIDYAQVVRMMATTVDEQPQAFMTGTEHWIGQVWQEILNLDQPDTICASSNFLSLGGHSVHQIALINRIEKQFGCVLDRRLALNLATQGSLRDLARMIDAQPPTPESMLHDFDTDSDQEHALNCRVSDSELRWWRWYQKADLCSQLNVTMAWKLTPSKLDTGKLVEACNLVLARHDIFRSHYVGNTLDAVERLQYSYAPVVHKVDNIHLKDECNRPFTLDLEFLVRVLVSPNILFFCASHIILDLAAMQIVLTEIAQVYAGTRLHDGPQLYAESCCRSKMITPSDTKFWHNNMIHAADSRRARLETDSVRSFSGSSVVLRLASANMNGLKKVTRRYHVTKHHIALAAVVLAFRATDECSSSEFVIGAPRNNRDESSSKVVGLCLDILPIVIANQASTETGSDWVKNLLENIRQSSQDSLSHAIPWSQLCNILNIQDHEPFTQMILDAMVTFHDKEIALDVPGLNPIMTWPQGAKFRVMFEFNVLANDELVLRIEYNSSIYSEIEVLELGRKVAAALRCISCNAEFENAPVPYSIGSKTPHLEEGEMMLLDESDLLFGAQV